MQSGQVLNKLDLRDIVQTEPVSVPPDNLSYGYWQASDGQWYPPELHATYVPFIKSVPESSSGVEDDPLGDRRLADDFTYFLGKELAPMVETKQQSVQHDPRVSAVGRWGIYESAYLLIGFGGVLLMMSVFLPWFIARGTTQVSLYAILKLTGYGEWVARWFMLATGAGCLVGALTAWRSVYLARFSVILGGVLFGDVLYGSWLYYKALAALPDTVFLGNGFILALAAMSMLFVGSFFIYRKRHRLQYSYERDVLGRHLLDV